MGNAIMAALIATGIATRYGPGVMDTVVENRQRWEQLPPGVKAGECVALMDCAWLGENIWLQMPDGSAHGPYSVCDCAAAQHRAELERIGFAVDLSYELAVQFGVLDGPMAGVHVWLAQPGRRYIAQ